MLDALGPFIDRGELRGHPLLQCRQLGDRDLMLAAEGAQREEPLLDLFEFARVELELARRGFQHRERLGGLRRGAFGRGERRIEKPLGALAGPLEPPRRPRQCRLRAGIAAELADRLGQGFGQPFGVLQQGAPLGEAILLALFGRQRLELGEVVAQQLLLLAARGEEPRGFGFVSPRRAPVVPGLRQRRGPDRMLGEGVEDHAMIGRIEQPALLELALDLDQAVAELAQQPDTRRRIVDKGAAAAVGREQPAQDDRLAVAVEPGLAQDRMGGMVASDRELGRYRGLLGPGAHEPGLRAAAERQTQRVQQDRLAGAGLAGQHAQPRAKGEREPIDQHDIANGQAEQHGADDTRPPAAKPAPAPRRVAAGMPVAAKAREIPCSQGEYREKPASRTRN